MAGTISSAKPVIVGIQLRVTRTMIVSNRKHVAHCPHCGAGYKYNGVKSLWGRVNRQLQLVKEGDPVYVETPCCAAPITYEDVKSMWGRATASRRSTYGAGPGRPKSKDRCPCGAMTAARAAQRGHKCVAPNVRSKRKT